MFNKLCNIITPRYCKKAALGNIGHNSAVWDYAGLGAVLALKHFSPQAALPNALFAIWCIITASVLAEVWSRRE